LATITTSPAPAAGATATSSSPSTTSTGAAPSLKLGPIENALAKFSSYNYKFTFGPLTNNEINFPDTTYRKTGPSLILIRTGGTGSEGIQHEYDKANGIRTEYFIDDLEVSAIVAPNSRTKQTNATSLSFKVFEPYSMGLFLRSLDVAAKQAGHTNYLQAPFLLTVEFVGWDDNGNFVTVPKSKRMFPLKLSSVSFSVTEGGSEYQVDAIPWHEQAFSDETQMIKHDMEIEGETIFEMLQTGPNSLATQLNSRELELEAAKNKRTGDQFVIIFPDPSVGSIKEGLLGAIDEAASATTTSRTFTAAEKKDLYYTITGRNEPPPADFDAEIDKILGIAITRSALGEAVREFAEDENNINNIGKSKIAKSYLDSGKAYFGKPAFSEDKEKNPGVFKRGGITIRAEQKKVEFAKGTKVQDIIEEIVLLSEYGRNFISEDPDKAGMRKWFRIEADVYNVTDPENEVQTGKAPKVYVYRVIPYGVHVGKLAGPTDIPPGFDELINQALKEYNYIYTGKNDDIINFDIQIDTAFFNSVMSDYGQLNADNRTANQDSMAKQPEAVAPGASSGRTDNETKAGTSTTNETIDASSGKQGGGAQSSPETQVARSYNDAIVNSNADMVAIQFEIWGDPYYIADSGMGNYNASEVAGYNNLNIDQAMSYQTSEVDIIVNFRTPLDIGDNGFMIFPELGSAPVGAFSGLYQVNQVDNKFSGGQFTQTINAIRRRNQPAETGNAPAAENVGIITDGTAIAPTPDQTVKPKDFIPDGFDAAASAGAGAFDTAQNIAGAGAEYADLFNGAGDLANKFSNWGINVTPSLMKNLAQGKLPDGWSADLSNKVTGALNAAGIETG